MGRILARLALYQRHPKAFFLSAIIVHGTCLY